MQDNLLFVPNRRFDYDETLGLRFREYCAVRDRFDFFAFLLSLKEFVEKDTSDSQKSIFSLAKGVEICLYI